MKRYGFFVSLAQVQNILSNISTMTDSNGNPVLDLPNYLKTVSNLRYSTLFHHRFKSQSKYLCNEVQTTINALEPDDISRDISQGKKESTTFFLRDFIVIHQQIWICIHHCHSSIKNYLKFYLKMMVLECCSNTCMHLMVK